MYYYILYYTYVVNVNSTHLNVHAIIPLQLRLLPLYQPPIQAGNTSSMILHFE